MKQKLLIFIELVKKSQFFKSVIILISGTVIAQIIPLLMQPYLRRVFTPEDFGAFSVISSMGIIFLDFTTLRYELAIVLPKKDSLAASFLGLMFILSLFFTSMVAILVLIFPSFFAGLIGLTPEYTNWIYFFPINIFAFSMYKFYGQWLSRQKAFMANSKNKLSRKIVEGIVQAIFAVFKMPMGLIFGEIMGNVANVVSGHFQSVKRNFSFKHIKWAKIVYLAKAYKDFPLYNTLPSLLNSAGRLMPIIFISKYYGSQMAGQFDLCKLIFIVPSSLLSTAIAQVLLQRIVELRHQKKAILPVFVRLASLLSGISVVAIIVISFFGTDLFTVFFGKQWSNAAEMAQIFVWSFAFTFIASPLSIGFTAMEKIKAGSIWQFVYAIVIIGYLYFFDYADYNIFIFLKIYTAINIVFYTAYFTLLISTARKIDAALVSSK